MISHDLIGVVLFINELFHRSILQVYIAHALYTLYKLDAYYGHFYFIYNTKIVYNVHISLGYRGLLNRRQEAQQKLV